MKQKLIVNVEATVVDPQFTILLAYEPIEVHMNQ